MTDPTNTLILTIDTMKIDTSETNPKEVIIRLRPDLAPNHVARIIELTQEGFYDGVVFHRVIPGFMAQGGDPNGTGMGGSTKPNLKAEFNNESHVRGICSMARSAAQDSANSQFFICFEDAKFLDKMYTVWGNVVSGMEHIDALPKGEPPRNPGKIISARIGGDPVRVKASTDVPEESQEPQAANEAFIQFRKDLQTDTSWAWSWHCNIAMPLHDSLGISHQKANETAATMMKHLFEIDVTQFEEWKHLEREWNKQDA